MRRLLATFSIVLSASAMAGPHPSPLPVLDEIAGALEAAPEHLRADAGVHVLEANGYRRARASRNGFYCLIDRDGGYAFEPKCFDIEGSDTLLPVILFRAAELARNATEAEIDRAVSARFACGDFIAPRRIGICYMLSAHNVVVDRDARQVARVGPRLMFYAPYLSNADVGAIPDSDSRLAVSHEGSETAMIVVPVSSEKRTRAYYLSPDELTPLTRVPATAGNGLPRRNSLDKPAHRDCDRLAATPCRIETPPAPVSPMH